MIYSLRPAIPQELSLKWLKYTRLYLRRIRYGRGSFYWNKYPNSTGRPINEIILRELLSMTQNHCSYCDRFPLYDADKTIDHFMPKRKFPMMAYRWENLYLSCDNCQFQKGDDYDDQLLKPDEMNYNFENYFLVDYFDFSLLINPLATRKNRNRARITIKLFNLNEDAHKIMRRNFFNSYNNTTGPDINAFPYRYLYPPTP